MIYGKFWLNVLIGLLYTRIYGQLAINMPSVGNYGEDTYINCTEANFDIADGYTWYKDNIKIYDDVNGETTSSGKYTSTYGTGYFTLTVTNTALNDAGVYACNYKFVPQSGTLEIQAKGTVTAELSSSSSGKLEVTFQKIYPNTTTVVVKCDSIIENGDFVSTETDGDGLTTQKWASDKNFTSVPTRCSVNVTLVTTFNVPFVVKSVTLPPDGNQTNTTTTPPTTSTTTPSASIPTSKTSTNSDSSSTSTTTSSAVVPNPATSPSSGNETTVIVVSSVVGGLFFVGIVIAIVLMLLLQRKKHQSVKHSRKHSHHDQDRRQKRPYNQGYPTLQEHGQYNNTSYMEYPGIGTKMNPLYVPNRSAYRAEQNYNLGHHSADHQSYIRNHHLYYNSNIRPQTSMHSYQQRYYGERGGNNMIRSGLPRDENNYVTPDYELYW